VTTRITSELFLVDSSGWLEYITEESKASSFAHYLENEAAVVVPSLVIYEVYRQLARHRGKPLADRFFSQALHCRVVPFDEMMALAAADLSLNHRLALTDAILYATARAHHAQFVTANTKLRGLPAVIIP
jgi:predicted nucleic acid-binding protein